MPDGRNLIITGFMGTGKTTVGRIVADRLGRRFVDTDEELEARHGAIVEIFRERGEAEFRSLERTLALELSEQRGLVVATGGGMMVDPTAREALGATGPVFCLTASHDELLDRLRNDPDVPVRPLLSAKDPRTRISELLDRRAAEYARFTQVDTEGKDPGEVADVVLGLWDSLKGSRQP